MAQASGPAMQGLFTEDFVHAPSRGHYRVYAEDGKAWMSLDRPGDNVIQGKKELVYFIGTGHRGRTYLFSQDGFVFEAPTNWYGQQRLWDMAPAYQKDREIPMNLPAVSSGLACHTSNSQAPLPGTENRYEQPLFCACWGNVRAVPRRGCRARGVGRTDCEPREAACRSARCHLHGVPFRRSRRHPTAGAFPGRFSTGRRAVALRLHG